MKDIYKTGKLLSSSDLNPPCANFFGFPFVAVIGKVKQRDCSKP